MNRLISRLIIVIIFALLLGVAISIDSGYVFIKYHTFEYESSLWVMLAIFVIIGFLIWLCIALVGAVFQLFGKVNPFSNERKQRHGELGLRELAEGNWSAALKHLKNAAKSNDASLSYYLGAAEAANELGETEKSDTFIEKACDYAPKAKMAIGLTYARLLITRKNYDKALSITKELYQSNANQPVVIRLLHTIYLQKEDWASLKNILPALKKHKILPDNTLATLEQYVWAGFLKGSFANNTAQPVLAIEQLNRAWDEIPANVRENHQLMEAYIQQLCMLGGHKEAEQLLLKVINKNYQPELVYLYGQVHGVDLSKQLNNAERWLNGHSDDPVLFLTLGRLCLYNKLWGKAKDYFEKSLQLRRTSETCSELAGLLAQHGEMQKSNELFQESLHKFHHSLKIMQ